MAWGPFTFLGRVRSWDGLIALVREPVSRAPFARRLLVRFQSDPVRILNRLFAGQPEPAGAIQMGLPRLPSLR
jgi:hypothetical protein